jgi:hypoxanthine phosphoribosyltransferase
MKICERIKRDGFNPDVIIGVSRGGWSPARVISDILENSNLASIRVEFYSDIYKTTDEPVITQQITIPIRDKKILVVDDISDTGKTLKLLHTELSKQAREIKTVTLYCKPWTGYQPNFYAKLTNAWIIFPWERHEMIKTIGKNMIKEGKKLNDIIEELIKSGLDPIIVTKFTKDIFGKDKQ